MQGDALKHGRLRRVLAITTLTSLLSSGVAVAQQDAVQHTPAGVQGRTATDRNPVSAEALIDIASELNEQYGASLRQRYQADPEVEGRRLLSNARLRKLHDLRTRDPEQYANEVLKMRTEASIARLAQRLRQAETTGLTSAQIDATRVELRTQLRTRDRLSLESREAYLCDVRDHISATQRELETYLKDAEQHAQDMYDALITDDTVDVQAVGPAQFAGWGFSEASPGVHSSAAVRMTPELARACLEVVKALTPDVAEELETLKQRDPKLFQRRLASSEQLVRLGWLKLSEPEVYARHVVEIQAQQDITRIVGELKETREVGRSTSSLERDLMNRIRIRVAMKYVLEQERVKQLRARLVTLETSLDADRDSVDARIDQQLVDLAEVPE